MTKVRRAAFYVGVVFTWSTLLTIIILGLTT